MSMSESGQYDLLDQLAEEFADRFRRGERPSLQEYTDRYPELAEEIRDLFPAMVKVERADDLRQGEEAEEAGDSRASNPPLSQVGDYRILRVIGRGGMGVVYEAEQISLGRKVALKVLPGQVSGDRMTQERFRREARAAARLHHTNIVPVYEVGQDGDVRYYAMQFIQGQGLDLVINELRRLRDRTGPESQIKAVVEGQSLRPRGAHSRQGIEGPTVGEGVEVSAVLRSILTGRFDPGDRCPELGGASPSRLARALAGGLATPTGTGTESRATGSDPAQTSTEAGSATAGDATGPVRADPPALALSPSASPSSSSAILPGGTQLSSIESGRRAIYRSLAHIGRQVAGGLAYAHARGIVHRDIKPANLLLDTEGVVWIADFGLAKGEDEGLTHTGDILGTIRYMAPERFRGEGDARADVYALGLTLYELLTLRPGFESPDRLKLIEQIKTEEPPRPRSVDARVPRDLETIVLKAIDKDPKARYQSAEAIGEDLRRFLADEPIRARRASAAERYARWARHHPGIAILGAVLTAVLVMVTIGSLLAANRFADLAEQQGNSATAERSARLAANQDRKTAEKARADAQAETYRAMLSEVKALRAGRRPGWRDETLAELWRLAVMPTPRRDLVELRTEAVATLGTPDIRLVTRIEMALPDTLGSIAFSRDGRTLVTTSHKTGLDFWDVHGQRHLASVEGLGVTEPRWRFNKAVYLARDQGLAVATQDHGVVFTDGRGIRTPRAPITRGASKPITLSIGAKGQRIAVEWTDGGGITVHDAASGTLLQRFDGFDNSPFALSPDGRWLARQESADVVLHPIGSGEPKVVLALGHHNRFRTLAFSPDGAMLAGACYDHTTMLWDVAGRKPFNILRGHRQRVINVAFSPDGEWIATTSGDYTTRIWETRTGQTLATLPGSGDMGQVVWSPDGNYLAVTTNWNSTVFLYRVTGRHDVQQWLTGRGAEAVAVASHPRLEQFTTVFANGELLTWDVSAPRPEHRRIGTEPGQGTALAYSPDGTLLATGSWSGATARTILVRDVRSSEIRCKIQCSNIPEALAFDESRQRLASGDLSGNLIVWNLATNVPLRQFATGSTIRSIAFLDGDHRLVTHDKGGVLLYNLQSGQLERRVTLPGDIRRFVVDRQRSRLVVAFHSGAIGSLSLPGLTPGHRLENAHNGSVECLALSPDGRLLAAGGADHRVVLRDPLTFEPLLNFPEWTRTLRDMAFDCTSRRLATVGTDSDLDLWDIAALNDGLTDVGLAWGRPTPVTAPKDGTPKDRASPTAAVVVIRPGQVGVRPGFQ